MPAVGGDLRERTVERGFLQRRGVDDEEPVEVRVDTVGERQVHQQRPAEGRAKTTIRQPSAGPAGVVVQHQEEHLLAHRDHVAPPRRDGRAAISHTGDENDSFVTLPPARTPRRHPRTRASGSLFVKPHVSAAACDDDAKRRALDDGRRRNPGIVVGVNEERGNAERAHAAHGRAGRVVVRRVAIPGFFRGERVVEIPDMPRALNRSAHGRRCVAPKRLRLAPQPPKQPSLIEAVSRTGNPLCRRHEVQRRGHRNHGLHEPGKERRLGKAEGERAAERKSHDRDATLRDAGIEIAHCQAGVGEVSHPVHVIVTLGKRAARRRAAKVEADHRRATGRPRACGLEHVPAPLAARESRHQDHGRCRLAPRMEACDEAVTASVAKRNLDAPA